MRAVAQKLLESQHQRTFAGLISSGRESVVTKVDQKQIRRSENENIP
jgi:hypothetical protein